MGEDGREITTRQNDGQEQIELAMQKVNLLHFAFLPILHSIQGIYFIAVQEIKFTLIVVVILLMSFCCDYPYA